MGSRKRLLSLPMEAKITPKKYRNVTENPHFVWSARKNLVGKNTFSPVTRCQYDYLRISIGDVAKVFSTTPRKISSADENEEIDDFALIMNHIFKSPQVFEKSVYAADSTEQTASETGNGTSRGRKRSIVFLEEIITLDDSALCSAEDSNVFANPESTQKFFEDNRRNSMTNTSEYMLYLKLKEKYEGKMHKEIESNLRSEREQVHAEFATPSESFLESEETLEIAKDIGKGGSSAGPVRPSSEKIPKIHQENVKPRRIPLARLDKSKNVPPIARMVVTEKTQKAAKPWKIPNSHARPFQNVQPIARMIVTEKTKKSEKPWKMPNSHACPSQNVQLIGQMVLMERTKTSNSVSRRPKLPSGDLVKKPTVTKAKVVSCLERKGFLKSKTSSRIHDKENIPPGSSTINTIASRSKTKAVAAKATFSSEYTNYVRLNAKNDDEKSKEYSRGGESSSPCRENMTPSSTSTVLSTATPRNPPPPMAASTRYNYNDHARYSVTDENQNLFDASLTSIQWISLPLDTSTRFLTMTSLSLD